MITLPGLSSVLTHEQITAKLHAVVAGQKADFAINATLDVLAMLIGFVSGDQKTAYEIVDVLTPELKNTIKGNWGEIVRVREGGRMRMN